MAHYALLDENDVVFDIITGKDEDDLIDGIESWEQFYGEFHNCKVKRTSYNTQRGEHLLGGTPFRLNYAIIGGKYVEEIDGFIEIQPYESWLLDETKGTWYAPTPKPKEGLWHWKESTTEWIEHPKNEDGNYITSMWIAWDERFVDLDSGGCTSCSWTFDWQNLEWVKVEETTNWVEE